MPAGVGEDTSDQKAGKEAQDAMDEAEVFNANPYHDELGKFASGDAGGVKGKIPKLQRKVGAAPKKFAGKLTDAEQLAIRLWTSDSSGRIRNSIRSGTEDEDANNLLSALKKLPEYEGTVWRGHAVDKGDNSARGMAFMAAIEKAGVGGTWEDSVPNCTSRSSDVSNRYARGGLLISMSVKTAKSVEQFSYKKPEKEVVTLPNTKYRIVSIAKNVAYKDKDFGTSEPIMMHVHMEEI